MLVDAKYARKPSAQALARRFEEPVRELCRFHNAELVAAALLITVEAPGLRHRGDGWLLYAKRVLARNRASLLLRRSANLSAPAA